MATSSKFDLSSSSPDRPLYPSGQRGSHIAVPLDRSGSFRESMENPALSSFPNSSRTSSAITQGDVLKFLQSLHFDPKLWAEHKSIRQGDFKRQISVALSISPDDYLSNSSKGKLPPALLPEEIKRVKTGLRESTIKARERVNILNEALSVFNECFPSIPSKKRSRLEGFSNDRSSLTLSCGRSAVGPSAGKFGNHSLTVGGFDHEQQRSEERTKNCVPNKRTRTSLVDMDVRSNALVRPPLSADRDREVLRLASSSAVQGEDRTLSAGVDGWEKSKMKKKRSGIKPDLSTSIPSAKPFDGYREPKQGIQRRPIADARSKLNNDSHGFRSGVANGAARVGKSDGISEQSVLGMRSSISRTELDSNSLINDRRDRPIGSDKERVNLRAVNKPNAREDFNSPSPTSTMKANASVRAPRTGSGFAPKLSTAAPRTTVSNDWELSHCTKKPPAAVGANNRKRTVSTQSSSPPVANWAGQRPQKISRTARRTNFVPIVSSNDDTPPLDSVSDVVGNDTGLGFARRFPGSSPQQVKSKGDTSSSAALSESEESVAAESKSKEKTKLSDELDDKVGRSVQKVSTLVLPSRKNKLVSGEDLGDGIRRQGRTGRGFTSSRSLMPMTVKKIGHVGTAKQLRSARLGLDKTESKAGRPPTRKLSDRKAYTRQKNTAINVGADFLDDGHEELLAAVNAVLNPGCAFSSSFWSQMEPFFGFISDADTGYLKQQGDLESSAPTLLSVASNLNRCNNVQNGFGMIEHETTNDEFHPEHLLFYSGERNDISLYQRLIAALIPEDVCKSENGDDVYGTEIELDEQSNSLHHQPLVNSWHTAFNGCTISWRPDHKPESDGVAIQSKTMKLNFSHSLNGSASYPLACSEFQYDDMQLNEKLLLEIQSIGIFPEPVPDISHMEDEGITEDIRKLEKKYRGQVPKKKGLLDKLLEASAATKELQEKEFETRAMEKLVGMAYTKYMECGVPNAAGGKAASNKMAKQASLAFVKRTLERCRSFEDAGKSCFSEPLFRDIFLSWSSSLSNVRSSNLIEGEPGKAYASFHSLEAGVPAPLGAQHSPLQLSQNVENHDSGYVPTPLNQSLDQTSGGEDSCSNRVKKRELLLDDVGGTSSVPTGIGSSLLSSAKGKRSERDRDGKGHNTSRNGTSKIGPSTKAERKSKTKPKPKTTQPSASVDGLLGKKPEQRRPSFPSVLKSSEMNLSNNSKEKDELGLDGLEDPIDLSHLQLPGMDLLGVSDDLDGQGQDLGSWLNIEDDGLHDQDFMGLEIPMDDLSDLNMMV